MSHPLLPGMDTAWIAGLRNIFLIRDPDEVVASYIKSRADVAPADIGLLQQVQPFDETCQRDGVAPPGIDAGDFLRAPAAHLRARCATGWGSASSRRCCAGQPGRATATGSGRRTGTSTSGERPDSIRRVRREGVAALSGEPARVADACRPAYEHLHRHRLQVVGGTGFEPVTPTMSR